MSWAGESPQKSPPGAVELTAGEEAEAREHGQRVGDGQQPVQDAPRLQQQRGGQAESGKIGKVVQFRTCGQRAGGSARGGRFMGERGRPTGVGLGAARPTHPAPSRRRAAGQRLRRPDPAGTPPAATSTSTGIAWGGQNGRESPFLTPRRVPPAFNFSPPVEAAEDGRQPRYQIGHREPVGRVFPDEFQRPAPARAQEQLLRGLENTCKAPRPPVKRPNRLFANAAGGGIIL